MSELLDFCLSYVVEQKGSDVHIVEGYPPYARIKGDLVKIPFRYPVVDRSMIETAVRKILKTEGAISRLYERDEIDLTYEHKGERFRVNVAIAQGKIFLAIRYLEETIPPPHELGVPKEFTDVIIKHSYGVAFLVGPTGSGKSTTLVSCISYMLSKVARRVVTIEDPVEYMITPGKGIVTQREVGRDTKAFSSALRAAMREDPDVILVGEVRDTETALNCLSAAETGHLVVTTLHT
ncbi:MAG: ATPase, T2SS/T4P/T4SS family, partial [Candidatus Methanomethylicaceae archaeon]